MISSVLNQHEIASVWECFLGPTFLQSILMSLPKWFLGKLGAQTFSIRNCCWLLVSQHLIGMAKLHISTLWNILPTLLKIKVPKGHFSVMPSNNHLWFPKEPFSDQFLTLSEPEYYIFFRMRKTRPAAAEPMMRGSFSWMLVLYSSVGTHTHKSKS